MTPIRSEEFYYVKADMHDVGPGQADTWTGNDDLPLFGKVNFVNKAQ